jgi:hypothetical protein
MKEGDQVAVRAFAGLLVDEADALGLETREFGPDVADAVGDVMQLARRVAAELLDRRIARERLEQFDDGVADRNADDLDALLLDRLVVEPRESERLGVQPFGGREVADDDADVIDGKIQTTTSLAA